MYESEYVYCVHTSVYVQPEAIAFSSSTDHVRLYGHAADDGAGEGVAAARAAKKRRARTQCMLRNDFQHIHAKNELLEIGTTGPFD